ncbi:MAG TPA: transcription elongation factor GreB [bacterium]|nr:transcription elongation factor GreB [bacterium]
MADVKGVPITRAGYQKLVEERDRLWKVDRPKVTQEVSDAAALGDRSENAEYIYGKKKLREIDRRLGFLNDRIERSIVVDPQTLTGDRVVFGATVTVEDLESGKVSTYMIVGEDEVDAANGRISHRSPVGRALLGKQVGDEVLVHRPAGELELEIRKIVFK